MTFWLVRRHVQQNFAWFFAALGAIYIMQWPETGAAVVFILMLLQLRLVPGRATVFDAALPISARDIVAARLVAKLLLMTVPTIACVVTWQKGFGESLPLPRFLQAMAILALAHLTPYCVRPSVLIVQMPEAYVKPFALLTVASGLVVWLVPSVLGAVILGGAVIALVARTVATMPASFERVTFEPRRAFEPPTSPSFAAAGRISTWAPIIRSVTPVWVIASFGMMTLGGLSSGALYNVVTFSVFSHAALRQRTAWLVALPLSHRARLLAMAVPFCLSLLGGFAIGRAVPKLFGLDRGMRAGAPYPAYESGKYYSSPTRVPLTFWKRMPAPRPPAGTTHIGQQIEILAPWGETAVADTFSILGVTYFDPFTTTRESSPRFVEWQFAKATQTVYGKPISRREYGDKAISRPRRVVDAWPVQLLGIGLALTILLYMLLTFELSLSVRAKRYATVGPAAIQGLLLWLPLFIVGGLCVFVGLDRNASIFIPMIERMLLAITRALPDNLLVVGLVAMIPPAVFYALLERQFARNDVSRAVLPTR